VEGLVRFGEPMCTPPETALRRGRVPVDGREAPRMESRSEVPGSADIREESCGQRRTVGKRGVSMFLAERKGQMVGENLTTKMSRDV
jgi:hypothetical protein